MKVVGFGITNAAVFVACLVSGITTLNDGHPVVAFMSLAAAIFMATTILSFHDEDDLPPSTPIYGA